MVAMSFSSKIKVNGDVSCSDVDRGTDVHGSPFVCGTNTRRQLCRCHTGLSEVVDED